jgi:hypothetical protein
MTQRFLTPLLGAAIIGLGVWLAVEHQKRLSLTEEHRALEQQRDQMAALIANNERMSNLLAQANVPQPLTDDQSRELLRLRGQIGVLRRQSAELAAVREENQQAHATLEAARKDPASAAPKSAATADYWPQDSWAFKGYGSPDATLQSSLWAANHGDVKALLASVTGEMQKQIAGDLGGKSETEASIRAMDEVMSMKSVRVVNREMQTDDTAVVTFEIESRTGTDTQKLVLKKIENEWKIFGPQE